MPYRMKLHSPDYWQKLIDRDGEDFKSNQLKGYFRKNFDYIQSDDYDSEFADCENINQYREAWDRILNDPDTSGDIRNEMVNVMADEAEEDRLNAIFESDAIEEIVSIMDDNDISIDDMLKYLRAEKKRQKPKLTKTEDDEFKTHPKIMKFFEKSNCDENLG